MNGLKTTFTTGCITDCAGELNGVSFFKQMKQIHELLIALFIISVHTQVSLCQAGRLTAFKSGLSELGSIETVSPGLENVLMV